jgi:hypothetical protein
MDRSSVVHQNFRHQLSLSLPPVDENAVLVNGGVAKAVENKLNGHNEVVVNGSSSSSNANKTYISVYNNGKITKSSRVTRYLNYLATRVRHKLLRN